MSGGTGESPLARSLCWHCQSKVGGEYFCDQCVKIQPIAAHVDYFQRLGLPRHLTIDLQELERRFYELSRKFHPDFFQRSSGPEQEISLQNSALLNKAYRALRDPVLRVEYLISLEEGAVKDIPAKAPPDLLEEILELQETLETYRESRKTDPGEIANLKNTLLTERERVQKKKAVLENELFGLFEEWDRLEDQRRGEEDETHERRQSLIKRMKEVLSARAYVRTVLEDLDAGLLDHSEG